MCSDAASPVEERKIPMSAIPLRDDVYYPESDGKPLGETALHRDEIVYLIQVLEYWYRDEEMVHVGGDLFLYYSQGNPRAVVCPDVFVVKDVPKLPERRTYKLWDEGEVPCLVIEVTSNSTRHEDLHDKKNLYEQLGVEELILYDPLGEYLKPRLQGYHLSGDRYQQTPLDPDGSLTSRTTGLILRTAKPRIEAFDPATGAPFARDMETRTRLASAEEEIARLRSKLKHLKGTE
jgi:Uma2 family endonuclease